MKKFNQVTSRSAFKEQLGQFLQHTGIQETTKRQLFRDIVSSDFYQKLFNDKQNKQRDYSDQYRHININDIWDSLSPRQKRIKLACDTLTNRRNFEGYYGQPISLVENDGWYHDTDHAIPIELASLESMRGSKRNAHILGHLLFHISNEGGISLVEQDNNVYIQPEDEDGHSPLCDNKELKDYKKLYITYTNGEKKEEYTISNIINDKMNIQEKVLIQYVLSTIQKCYNTLLTGKELGTSKNTYNLLMDNLNSLSDKDNVSIQEIIDVVNEYHVLSVSEVVYHPKYGGDVLSSTILNDHLASKDINNANDIFYIGKLARPVYQKSPKFYNISCDNIHKETPIANILGDFSGDIFALVIGYRSNDGTIVRHIQEMPSGVKIKK